MRMPAKTPGKNERLACLLAAGHTVAEAAAAAGLSERSAYRRLADPLLRARVVELRAQMTSQAVGRLADAAADAVATLRRNLTCGSPAVEVRAAAAILDHVLPKKGQASQEEPTAAEAEGELVKVLETIVDVLRDGYPDAAGAVSEVLMGWGKPSTNGHAHPPDPPEPRCGFVELPPGED
jgi:hypothetical protein